MHDRMFGKAELGIALSSGRLKISSMLRELKVRPIAFISCVVHILILRNLIFYKYLLFTVRGVQVILSS